MGMGEVYLAHTRDGHELIIVAVVWRVQELNVLFSLFWYMLKFSIKSVSRKIYQAPFWAMYCVVSAFIHTIGYPGIPSNPCSRRQ